MTGHIVCTCLSCMMKLIIILLLGMKVNFRVISLITMQIYLERDSQTQEINNK